MAQIALGFDVELSTPLYLDSATSMWSRNGSVVSITGAGGERAANALDFRECGSAVSFDSLTTTVMRRTPRAMRRASIAPV
jgi:hypothetical protein